MLIKNTEMLTLELDSYILSVKQTNYESMISSPPVYYMYGNPNKESLVEVGFDYDSGCFLSLTLVNCDNCLFETQLPLPNKNFKHTSGLPCIDKSEWESLDEPNIFIEKLIKDFKLFLGEDYLTFRLSDSKPTQYIVNDLLRFGLDKNECLVTIDLLNLVDKDVNIIKNM